MFTNINLLLNINLLKKKVVSNQILGAYCVDEVKSFLFVSWMICFKYTATTTYQVMLDLKNKEESCTQVLKSRSLQVVYTSICPSPILYILLLEYLGYEGYQLIWRKGSYIESWGIWWICFNGLSLRRSSYKTMKYNIILEKRSLYNPPRQIVKYLAQLIYFPWIFLQIDLTANRQYFLNQATIKRH